VEIDAILRAHDVVAVLGRDVAVRLVDISNAGCLIQSETRLAEGTIGTLRLSVDGVDYTDDVRIVRCQPPVVGDSWFRLGVQFLWTTHPGERSLRRVIAGMQTSMVRSLRFDPHKAS